MFETLDTMISFGVIFLILSMVNKYIISFVKRVFKIKAKVITKELETFIGEKTSKYLIPYLEKKAKHLNFLDDSNRLRKLSKEELKSVIGELETFMKSEDVDEFKKVFNIDISVDDIKKKVQGELDEIKTHLNTLQDKVEKMYDNTMEKISEVYETKLRYRALIFGIGLAFIINADFFDIYNSLSKNSIISEQLAARADVINADMELLSKKIEMNETKSFGLIKDEYKTTEDNIGKLTDTITNAGLELGWPDGKIKKVFDGFGTFIYKLTGLLIAGLLISFGAPFWHDFIGTFTGLRKTLTELKAAPNDGKKDDGK